MRAENVVILSDRALRRMLPQLIAEPERDPTLINPASIDIRIGRTIEVEGPEGLESVVLRYESAPCKEHLWWPVPYHFGSYVVGFPTLYYCNRCGVESVLIGPKTFLLAATLETISVPIGYAVDLRLKSSRAREGWDHSLAFWVDPGWDGVLTMEIQNQRQHTSLRLICGMRFGQMIVHELDRPPERPYSGRYQGADSVQGSLLE